ncbi:MAG: GTP pyrophosphokinase family protein [Lachnospiraceae bacterium]|nr:GTP pyrophosphokinase family protein [Lachnospiraceae bacterium]
MSIYGDHVPAMEQIKDELLKRINELRVRLTQKYGSDPVDHCLARIKSDESMREKCRRNGLPETTENALTFFRDAIGLRIVCSFLSDVYTIRNYLVRFNDLELVEEKDYIKKAKDNGYRSLHLIVKTEQGYYVEIQLRTISMDTWAALEHQMKYKKDKMASEELIVSELKRCADELASTDVSMQTIRDMIFTEEGASVL